MKLTHSLAMSIMVFFMPVLQAQDSRSASPNDKWEKWRISILSLIKEVEYALIDGTFFSAAEVNNRNIAEIPHPLVQESMELFDSLLAKEKEKIIFIHFNHTNPLLDEASKEARLVKSKGFRIASINFQVTL